MVKADGQWAREKMDRVWLLPVESWASRRAGRSAGQQIPRGWAQPDLRGLLGASVSLPVKYESDNIYLTELHRDYIFRQGVQ